MSVPSIYELERENRKKIEKRMTPIRKMWISQKEKKIQELESELEMLNNADKNRCQSIPVPIYVRRPF